MRVAAVIAWIVPLAIYASFREPAAVFLQFPKVWLPLIGEIIVPNVQYEPSLGLLLGLPLVLIWLVFVAGVAWERSKDPDA